MLSMVFCLALAVPGQAKIVGAWAFASDQHRVPVQEFRRDGLYGVDGWACAGDCPTWRLERNHIIISSPWSEQALSFRFEGRFLILDGFRYVRVIR